MRRWLLISAIFTLPTWGMQRLITPVTVAPTLSNHTRPFKKETGKPFFRMFCAKKKEEETVKLLRVLLAEQREMNVHLDDLIRLKIIDVDQRIKPEQHGLPAQGAFHDIKGRYLYPDDER